MNKKRWSSCVLARAKSSVSLAVTEGAKMVLLASDSETLFGGPTHAIFGGPRVLSIRAKRVKEKG